MAKTSMARIPSALKRRTTLTLPSESLAQAERIARSRHVTLSTVLSELVAEGLKFKLTRERGDEIPENYRRAFTGFSDDELAILGGVILEVPLAKR